ncbi:MAG: FAD-binding oxidoreductase [Chloracidobacterium sp.]|nr:FAD-binding oxidoreductase [Chloracidobacterium sp.]
MQVKTQPDDILNYLTDASNMPGGHAERLFIPETADEIAAILRDANEARIPVTVSGARTGTVGGAVPFGGWVISMERLNAIKSIDKEGRRAVVEPGVVLADFAKAVEAEGLFYPPDPTEWSCQIGGTVATNASGARSFKYGATREYVVGLTVVLADGDLLEIRRGESRASESGSMSIPTPDDKAIVIGGPTYRRPNVTKNVSGYFAEPGMDLIDLFIGSEGTLGVITEIELLLLPRPQGFFSGMVFFKTPSDLMWFVDEAKTDSLATRSGEGHKNVSGPIDATLIEFFDDRALSFIAEKFPETPANMVGAIFFEQETSAETEDELLEGWNYLLERCNADIEASWFTTNEQDREKMRSFRHALPVAVNERVVRNKQKKIGTDMAVPDENFSGFLGFQKKMLDESGIDYVIFGHIGDCHLHANLLPKDDAEAEKARHIYGRFVAQSIMLGGCISAEHGIGKLKSKYLYVMMGERYLNEMADLKRAFDPKNILGRGNMFGSE